MTLCEIQERVFCKPMPFGVYLYEINVYLCHLKPNE